MYLSEQERKERIDKIVETGYLQKMMYGLGLDNWYIRCKYDRPFYNQLAEQEPLAMFNRRPGSMEGNLYLSDEFFALPPKEKRKTLCHELLHAHMRPFAEAQEAALEHLGKAEQSILNRVFYNAEEQVVDNLAFALAGMFDEFPEYEDRSSESLGHAVAEVGQDLQGDMVKSETTAEDVRKRHETKEKRDEEAEAGAPLREQPPAEEEEDGEDKPQG